MQLMKRLWKLSGFPHAEDRGGRNGTKIQEMRAGLDFFGVVLNEHELAGRHETVLEFEVR